MIKMWNFEFNYVQGMEADFFERADNHARIQTTFKDTIDRLAALEPIGFDGVFFSEHHFINALSPAPNLFVAALSQRTEAMRIGVMGNVLPFHQPWRLAEELGMLDYLTEGRLEIGMSSGVPPEFVFVGIPQEEVRPIYDEVQEFLELAFRHRFVTYKGKHFDFDEIPILPQLRPEQRRRKWVTLYSASTARKAAEMDYKICTAYQSVANARKSIEAYFERADECGFAMGPDDVGIRRQVLICDTDREAEDLHPELLEGSQKRMEATFANVQARLNKEHGVGMSEGVRQSGVMDAASPAQKGSKSPVPTDFVCVEDEFIYGSPETVAEKIIDQCRRLGAANFMEYHSSSLMADQVKHMYATLWPRVMSVLNSAQVGSVAN